MALSPLWKCNSGSYHHAIVHIVITVSIALVGRCCRRGGGRCRTSNSRAHQYYETRLGIVIFIHNERAM